jgi:hypothetical protein
MVAPALTALRGHPQAQKKFRVVGLLAASWVELGSKPGLARASARVGPGPTLAIICIKKNFLPPFKPALTFLASGEKSKILVEGESSHRENLLHTRKIAIRIHFHCLSRPQINFAIPVYFI